MNFTFLAIVTVVAGALSTAAPEPGSNACRIDHAKSPAFDVQACDAAIAAQADSHAKALLFEMRAYAKDESGSYTQFQSAMEDLNEALKLDPDLSQALHERAYLENEFGDYALAEKDLDVQAKLTPNQPQVYEERALARFLQGNLQGAFEDRDRETILAPDDAGGRLARGGALLWLGRFAEAEQDIAAGVALAQKKNDKHALDYAASLKADLIGWQTPSDTATAVHNCNTAQTDADFRQNTIIGDCTRAFLYATTNKARADALTQRYTAIELWKQRRDAGLSDLRLAYAFAPENPAHAFNLSSLLASIGRGREALKYVNIAIAQNPDAYGLGERAAIEYDLGDVKAAFMDAKKSFELKPNEIALTMLGDYFFEQKHDTNAAKLYWLGAYHLGDRDDSLKARLEKIGVAWPPPETPADSK
jgi:tetratricopeptide (TPR) repeat protein